MTGYLSDQAIDGLPVAAAAAGSVIDLSAPEEQVIKAIDRACRDRGYFQIINHGIPEAVTGACFSAMRRFFSRPAIEKRALSRTLDNPWGYNDRELTKTIRDRKEIFDVGPNHAAESGHPAERVIWPAGDSAFAQDVRQAAMAFEALARRLLRLVAAGLGITGEAIDQAFLPAHSSFLRLNRFPAIDPLTDVGRTDAGRGIHHHSDAGALTILLEDGTPGLQMLHAGQWHDVVPVPRSLIVNIGDMVQVWSNDQYKAPLHRVLAMEKGDRLSAPFFLNPSYSATIRPLAEGNGQARYRDFSWSEFRRFRADGDFGNYGNEVQISDYSVSA